MTHNEIDGNPWTSNRPLRGGKANTYEGRTRVPWIVSWPGQIKAGTTCNTLVQTTDIYPTVLELAGVKPRAGVDWKGGATVHEINDWTHPPCELLLCT